MDIEKEYRNFVEAVKKKEVRYKELISMDLPYHVLTETVVKENLADIHMNGMPLYSSGNMCFTKVDDETMEIRLYGSWPRLHLENYRALEAEARENMLELDPDKNTVDMRGYANTLRHSSYRFKKDGKTVVDVLDEGMSFCIQAAMSEKYLGLIGKIMECGKP